MEHIIVGNQKMSEIEINLCNKKIAEYLVGKTNEVRESSQNLLKISEFMTDWNAIICVLKKLTPDLEEMKTGPKNGDKHLCFGGVLCMIETHLTMYDNEMLWLCIIEGIDLLIKYKY